MSKIKLQDGDLIEIHRHDTSYRYLLVSRSFSSGLSFSSGSKIIGPFDFNKTTSNFSFIGILNPRFTGKQRETFRSIRGYSDYRGSIIEDANSILLFRSYGRRLSDV